MTRVLLVMLALAACDFSTAFDDYCRDTGRCDGGAGGGSELGGGVGGGSVGGGSGGGVTGGGVGGGVTGGGVGGGVTGGGVGGGVTGGGVGGSVTGGGVGGGQATGGGAQGGGVGGGASSLPTCGFASLEWTSSSVAEAGRCTSGAFARRPDGGGMSDNCAVLVSVASTPAGVEFFGDGSCSAAPYATGISHSVRYPQFGTYLYTLQVTDSRATFSTSLKTVNVSAELQGDAGVLRASTSMAVCQRTTFVTQNSIGDRVSANAPTVVNVTATQGGNSVLCDAGTSFTLPAGGDTIVVGVRPASAGPISVVTQGIGLRATTTTFRACYPMGTTGCSSNPQICCAGTCSLNQCD